MQIKNWVGSSLKRILLVILLLVGMAGESKAAPPYQVICYALQSTKPSTTSLTGRNGALPATAESIIDSIRSVLVPICRRSIGLGKSVWQAAAW